jgi:hypothetical protein
MLTPDDVTAILIQAAARDGRSWSGEDAFRLAVRAWAADLDDAWLTPGIAAEALRRHSRSETRRITIADLLGWAREIRAERLARVPLPDPTPEMAADPRLYTAGFAAAEAAILAEDDPETPPAELTARAAKAMAAGVAVARAELTGGRPAQWPPLAEDSAERDAGPR